MNQIAVLLDTGSTPYCTMSNQTARQEGMAEVTREAVGKASTPVIPAGVPEPLHQPPREPSPRSATTPTSPPPVNAPKECQNPNIVTPVNTVHHECHNPYMATPINAPRSAITPTWPPPVNTVPRECRNPYIATPSKPGPRSATWHPPGSATWRPPGVQQPLHLHTPVNPVPGVPQPLHCHPSKHSPPGVPQPYIAIPSKPPPKGVEKPLHEPPPPPVNPAPGVPPPAEIHDLSMTSLPATSLPMQIGELTYRSRS
ncbi:uncharacterized protein [Palaemon carinicauda]|uniref:uncharacterized protein n=1 Tax=Palaemon carinicauda TaxID=392227 RepID=UPI0035B60307